MRGKGSCNCWQPWAVHRQGLRFVLAALSRIRPLPKHPETVKALAQQREHFQRPLGD